MNDTLIYVVGGVLALLIIAHYGFRAEVKHGDTTVKVAPGTIKRDVAK